MLSGCDKHQARRYPSARCWQKMEMVDLLFKFMLLIIGLFVWNKKGPMFLFQNCMNATIMVDVLNFMVKTYLVVLFITHRFRPLPFSLLLVSACLLHTDGELMLRPPQKIPYTYWQFCSAYPYLHPLVGIWWWFGKSWTRHCPWSWVQG